MFKQLLLFPFCFLVLPILMGHAAFASTEPLKDEDCSQETMHAYYAFSMAKIYLNHKMLEKAEEMLREAMIMDSCSSSLHAEAADLFLKMGKENEADYFSSKSLEIDPDNNMGLRVQALLKGTRALMLKDEAILNESLILGQKALEKNLQDSRIYSLLIQLYFEKGNLEQAAQTLGDYFSRFQGNLGPVFLAADIMKESEESFLMDRFFRVFLSQDSISPRMILMIGNVLESGGYLRSAQHLYHEASLRHQNVDLIVKDSFALYEMENYEECIEAIEKIKGPFREEDFILRLLASAQRKVGQMTSAKGNYERLFQMNPQNGSLAAEIGDFYQSIGDIKNAIAYFKLALALQSDFISQSGTLPPRISLSLRIALLFILEGDFREARKILSQSQKYGSEKEVSYYILASKAEEHRSIKKALKIIKRAKKLFPSHAGLLVREAELYLPLDETKAEELLKSAIQVSNHNKEQYLYISRTLRDFKQFELAETFLRKALVLYPDSDIFLEMGTLMERWKRYQEAETFLKNSIEQDPSNAIALNYLGYMLAEQSERYQEALSFVQRALKLDSYNGAYLDSLGFIYLKLGMLDRAEKNILAAAEMYPFDPEIKEHLGDLYYAQGDMEKAIKEWESALQLNIEMQQKIKSKISRAQSHSPFYDK